MVLVRRLLVVTALLGGLAAPAAARPTSARPQPGRQVTTQRSAPTPGGLRHPIQAARRSLHDARDRRQAARAARAALAARPIYVTTPLRRQYLAEEVSSPDLEYLGPKARAAYEIHVDPAGKLVHPDGRRVDTADGKTESHGRGAAIYVMDRRGRIYLAKQQKWRKFHHSSLLAGGPVAAAGEMIVADGEIVQISRQSGHYRPSPALGRQILDELDRQGVDVAGLRLRRATRLGPEAPKPVLRGPAAPRSARFPGS